MRKGFLSIALAALAVAGSGSFAGTDVNEVGALLVYPLVATLHGPTCPLEPQPCEGACFITCNSSCEGDEGCIAACLGDCLGGCLDSTVPGLVTPPAAGGTADLARGPQVESEAPPSEALGDVVVPCPESLLTETFITVTNAGPAAVVAHFTYIDGNEQDLVGTYCEECDFSVPLTGNDTETLVLTSDGAGTMIRSEDSGIEMSCPFAFGMLVVSIENAAGITLSDNVLLGDLVVANYADGSAFSIPAIPFQGLGNDGDRVYRLDGTEYARLPRIVAADFLAPPAGGQGSFAALNLFTLDFERHHAPLTDCSVTGFDAAENPFSASFQFGCWTVRDLCEISPEFCYPNLGVVSGGGDTHGWLQLNCRVDRDPSALDGFETNGGVHGAILEQREDAAAAGGARNNRVNGQAAWARLLYQSVTSGDATTLRIETPSTGLF